MADEFLSDTQQERYGKYSLEPDPAQLARYFHFNEADHDLITRHRSDYNRLGFALQLCTVRFLGTFLADPTAVPAGVAQFVAAQLDLKNPLEMLPAYLVRPTTRWEHTAEIKQHFGYKDFTDQPHHFRLVRWLYARAWLSAERPSVLFDLATHRLVEAKILLPGVSVMTRLVASVRDKVANRLWHILARLPTAEQKTRLETLLSVPTDQRLSVLDQLRRTPTKVTGNGMVAALERFTQVQSFEVNRLGLKSLPPGRIKALARYAMATRAQTIERMSPERRIATLVAFIYWLEPIAQDEVVSNLDSHRLFRTFGLISNVIITKLEAKGFAASAASLPGTYA